MNRLFDIEILVRVVRTGSYTQAARELGISKSYASKQIRALEDRLGVRLLNRTTRTVTATDAGQRLVDRCTGLLDELEAAERDVTALQDSPRGRLRLSAPVSFGTRFIAPALSRFMQRFPDLAVVADLSDRRVDLIEEGYDLAVRIGRLDDASHLARRLAATRSCLVASPDYVAAHGAPERPEDLRDHPCMVYSLQASPTSWALSPVSGDSDVARVRVSPRLTSNNGDALLAAARAGLGVASLPDFFVGDLIRSGELSWLLPGWQPTSAGGVWAVHPAGRFVPVKTRLLVEHLAEELATPPWSLPESPQP